MIEFPLFVQEFAVTCSAVFGRCQRVTDLERWYLRLVTAIVETIPRVAGEHPRGPVEVIKMGEHIPRG